MIQSNSRKRDTHRSRYRVRQESKRSTGRAATTLKLTYELCKGILMIEEVYGIAVQCTVAPTEQFPTVCIYTDKQLYWWSHMSELTSILHVGVMTRTYFPLKLSVSIFSLCWIFKRSTLRLTLIPHLVSLQQTWGRQGRLETHCLEKHMVRQGDTSQSNRFYFEWCCWFWTYLEAVFPQPPVWRCCPEKGRVSRSLDGPVWTSSHQSEKVRLPSLGNLYCSLVFSNQVTLNTSAVTSITHFSNLFFLCRCHIHIRVSVI